MRCERCGQLNYPASKVCEKCGEPLKKKIHPVPDPSALPSPEAASESASKGKPKSVRQCDFCQGVFGPDDIYRVGDRYACEACLPRAEALMEKPGSGGRSADDRKSPRYLREQAIGERLREEGRSPTHMTLTWPKCKRHPDRSTREKCAACGDPICAMCTRRRGEAIYCPSCFARASGLVSARVSGKFSGFSGSYFETVKEVLFGPGAFFRNLPGRGEIVRPFLFAMINWLPGNLILLLVLSFLILRMQGTPLDLDAVGELLLPPVLYGTVVLSALLAVLGWIPLHLAALAVGGRARAEKGFRMTCLASAFSLINIVPFAGAALSPVFAASTLIRAVSEVYEMDLIRSFLVFVLGYGVWVGSAWALLQFAVFAGL